jgi:tetratricopeptide (TPR) repeat protein
VVVNAHVDPAQPVEGARVTLSFVSGSEKVVTARDATNRAGQALLLVSQEATQRGDLRIEITGVSDLVIYEPADGQLAGVPAAVTIKLLPKGSPALLGPPQMEALLRRLSLRNKHLEQENREVTEKLAAAQNPKQDDLTAAMMEWAGENGFGIADVDKKVQQWAEEIQQRKQQATDEQRALAELALKHYGAAAQMFNQAADDIGQSMDEEEKRFLEERRKQLREFADKKFQSSNTYQLNNQYHQATQILEQTCTRAAAEHGRYPEDAALRDIWQEAVLRLANGRREEGANGEASQSSALLAQSIKDYQGLLQAYTVPQEREDWARAQNNLGYALTDLGERSSEAQAAELLAQAVAAFRASLEVETKATMPRDWAATQNNLGNALWRQGERSNGAQATELFAQAAQAFRAALEVITRADQPQDWAMTETNVGNALWEQAERSSGTQATDLYSQAVEAFRAALEVYTKADSPQEWARTQGDLGNALGDEGERSSGAQATELFAQSVKAFRAALEVYTKADLPQDWARTQNNLGLTLTDQGEQSSGPQATDLFAQAVDAFRAALQVFTKADLPQAWALAQTDIGIALADEGERNGGARATDFFAQAVVACRAALEVQTKAGLPWSWALTQYNLGIDLTKQGERSSGAPAAESLAQAVDALRAALEVFTKADAPEQWAETQQGLGDALVDRAERSSGAQATELLAQAVDDYRAALTVQTRADVPQDWATTENGLAGALADQGDISGASQALESSLEVSPEDIRFLHRAASIYRNKLDRYDRAYELTQRWLKIDASPDAQLNMVEADLTTSRFEDCEKQAAAIDDASIPAPATPTLMLRDAMKLACQWGAGQKAAAQQTGNDLLPEAAQLQNTGWEFGGTLHFLASSPAFTTGRAAWIALFQSLQDGNGVAMAAALNQLEEVMKH